MSKAGQTFARSIGDAENLLRHFNELNSKPPPPELEVLKRAGLVMAMTAWETYVEDRLLEACEERLAGVGDETVASLIRRKLDDEIKRLNNPTSPKTLELFRDYAGVDLAAAWHWNHMDAKTARERLDGYMKLRGDIVHRSRPVIAGVPAQHPVRKDDLAKAISFLKHLVAATDQAVEAGCRSALRDGNGDCAGTATP